MVYQAHKYKKRIPLLEFWNFYRISHSLIKFKIWNVEQYMVKLLLKEVSIQFFQI